MEYKIVTVKGVDISELEAAVAAEILEDWVPQGGVCCNSRTHEYSQAMIKETT